MGCIRALIRMQCFDDDNGLCIYMQQLRQSSIIILYICNIKETIELTVHPSQIDPFYKYVQFSIHTFIDSVHNVQTNLMMHT